MKNSQGKQPPYKGSTQELADNLEKVDPLDRSTPPIEPNGNKNDKNDKNGKGKKKLIKGAIAAGTAATGVATLTKDCQDDVEKNKKATRETQDDEEKIQEKESK